MIFIAIKIRKLENTGTKLIGLQTLALMTCLCCMRLKFCLTKARCF